MVFMHTMCHVRHRKYKFQSSHNQFTLSKNVFQWAHMSEMEWHWQILKLYWLSMNIYLRGKSKQVYHTRFSERSFVLMLGQIFKNKNSLPTFERWVCSTMASCDCHLTPHSFVLRTKKNVSPQPARFLWLYCSNTVKTWTCEWWRHKTVFYQCYSVLG